jgi:phosphate transport system substrate-binding protein
VWAPAYKSQFPNITITTAGTGSGTGISSAAAGTANIGASDAYLSSADATKYPSNSTYLSAVHFQPLPSRVRSISEALVAKIS